MVALIRKPAGSILAQVAVRPGMIPRVMCLVMNRIGTAKRLWRLIVTVGRAWKPFTETGSGNGRLSVASQSGKQYQNNYWSVHAKASC